MVVFENNNLSFNNCFSYRNVCENGIKAFSKMFFFFFLNCFALRSSKFCTYPSVLFCSNFTIIWSAYGANTYQIIYRETFKLSMSAFARVACESFNDRMVFWSAFYVTIIDADVGSNSTHHLISIWTTCFWLLDKSCGPKYTKLWAFW